MQIINAVKIGDIIYSQSDIYPEVNYLSLAFLEQVFVKQGWCEGSFGLFKVTYSDEETELYLDYPTDISEEEAVVMVEKVSKELNNKG